MALINLEATTSGAATTNGNIWIDNPPPPVERPGTSLTLRILYQPSGSLTAGGPTVGQLFPVGNR